MRPIFAILLDSVRHLRAKRLFWFVLAISFLIVLAYGSIGFNEKGPTILYGWKQINQPFLAKGSILSHVFMEGIFSAIIVNIWLAWGAIILALVSTAGILPDFLAGGSIDLVLAKPISRVKLFLTKYVGSLTFVFLQVLIFTVGVYLVLGWRAGDWRLKVFLAVPLIVLQFSYLYCIMALLNVWTKSTLASLLITIVAWMGISGLNLSNNILQVARINFQTATEVYTKRANDQEQAASKQTGASQWEIQQAESRSKIMKQRVEDAQKTLDTLQLFTGTSYWLAAVLPKTSETVGLLQRQLQADSGLSFEDIVQGNFGQNDGSSDGEDSDGNRIGFIRDHEIEQLTKQRATEYIKNKPASFIIGTSLAFEFVLLGLTLFIFVRQDY